MCSCGHTLVFFVRWYSLCSLFTVFAKAHLQRESAFVCHHVPCILIAVVALAHCHMLYLRNFKTNSALCCIVFFCELGLLFINIETSCVSNAEQQNKPPLSLAFLFFSWVWSIKLGLASAQPTCLVRNKLVYLLDGWFFAILVWVTFECSLTSLQLYLKAWFCT